MTETMTEDNISPVLAPQELEEAKKRLMEVRFNCLVKMYDCGIRTVDTGLIFTEKKPLPPQWFVLTEKFTLEFIRHSDERQIGNAIKEAYNRLEQHIKNYEGQ